MTAKRPTRHTDVDAGAITHGASGTCWDVIDLQLDLTIGQLEYFECLIDQIIHARKFIQRHAKQIPSPRKSIVTCWVSSDHLFLRNDATDQKALNQQLLKAGDVAKTITTVLRTMVTFAAAATKV